MIIKLSYNDSVLSLGPGETSEIFLALKNKFTYNPIIPNLEKKVGRKFNRNSIEVLEEFLPATIIHKRGNVKASTAFSNYVAYRINVLKGRKNTHYHPILKRNFSYYSDGSKCPFRISSRSKNVKVRTGFVRMIAQWFVEKYPDNELNIVDLRTKEPLYFKPVTQYELGNFIARDNQVEAIDALIKPFQGLIGDTYSSERAEMAQLLLSSVLLEEAVSSGKTFIAASLFDNMINPIAIFPFRSVGTFAQTTADYIEMGLDVSVVAAETGGKKKNGISELNKELEKRGLERNYRKDHFGDLLFIMQPTYLSRVKNQTYDGTELQKYNVGFFDEVQELVSPTAIKFLDMMELMLKIGYSGTPTRSSDIEKRALVTSNFGAPVHVRTVAENTSDGFSLPVEVQFYDYRPEIPTTFTGSIRKAYMYYSQERVDLLISILEKNKGKKSIIYTGQLELKMSRWLFKKIREKFNKVGYVDGQTGSLADFKQDFKEGVIEIGIVNVIAKKGINMSSMEYFYNWYSSDDLEGVEQSAIGRLVRLHEGMEKGVVVDFMDYVPGYINKSRVRDEFYKSKRIGATVKYFDEDGKEKQS
jgi:hypothetical protein